RARVGLKQVQVAERTGIAQSRLSRYENGRKLPDLPTLDRLLVCYGVDMEGLGRALAKVRGEPVAKTWGSDPELTAVVKEALAQLGYFKPEEPD
ncbi:MAG TPA: helix-turn-helix transcriptional regulator, partial [Thermoanaerobaculia bacterium]|nr:helix-turn-helix transcriptional regulator [Thermoanaerobaculia bacterium]